MPPGAQAYIDAMTELGLRPTVEANLVICCFTPVSGARAGTTVEVGVALDELGSWPQIPPYWVHLPSDVKIPDTGSSKGSPKQGWLQHSRQHPGWVQAPPAANWSGHIQAVLKDAVS